MALGQLVCHRQPALKPPISQKLTATGATLHFVIDYELSFFYLYLGAELLLRKSYIGHETIHLPPHVLAVAFRERLSESDWQQAKRLEQFHYRGKGFNRIPGRRTALVLEAANHGVIGYGILSNTLSSAKPRSTFSRPPSVSRCDPD